MEALDVPGKEWYRDYEALVGEKFSQRVGRLLHDCEQHSQEYLYELKTTLIYLSSLYKTDEKAKDRAIGTLEKLAREKRNLTLQSIDVLTHGGALHDSQTSRRVEALLELARETFSWTAGIIWDTLITPSTFDERVRTYYYQKGI